MTPYLEKEQRDVLIYVFLTKYKKKKNKNGRRKENKVFIINFESDVINYKRFYNMFVEL